MGVVSYGDNLNKELMVELKMKKAQSVLEYAMLISIIVLALMGMSVYVQRSVQGNLKMIEDRVNAEPAR